ncbi:hypothetical protein RvY_13386 [Ramazzottius varieornatus]|uniref:Uncharacterized protein n=1 Tax=Ramazzottius varieornatus TaxID=947166 RepID=A0A1D1VV67_RAMVA|nr:hypothetical protein RvY_13386 [Ramazzottius varieornatus]
MVEGGGSAESDYASEYGPPETAFLLRGGSTPVVILKSGDVVPPSSE